MSGVWITLSGVYSCGQALEAFDSRAIPWGPPTGITRLDELTGGMVPGQVWIIVGDPGHGRTTLLLQLAETYARSCRAEVHVHAPLEQVSHVVSRMLASRGRVPLRASQRGHPIATDREGPARELLSQSGLRLSARDFGSRDDWCRHDADPAALFLDDADVLGPIDRLRATATSHAFVCLTLPRHLVVRPAGEDETLDPEWSRVADLILDVRIPGHLLDEHPRQGEADLRTLRNRRGPLSTIAVSFQGHYSRFVDLR